LTAFGVTFKLDIIEPDTDDVLPLAVIIHGGGFIGGDKNSNENWAINWANRDYRAININYPLCGNYWQGADNQQHPWNAAEPLETQHLNCTEGHPRGAPEWFAWHKQEVASRAARYAIKWAHDRANADEFAIDTATTVCHGSSAGSVTCLDTFLFNTTISYANAAAPAEQEAGGLPQQANLLMPNPDLDYIKIDGHIGMSFGDQRNLTQETVDAMALKSSAYVMHDPLDEFPPHHQYAGMNMGGVENLERNFNLFGITNEMHTLYVNESLPTNTTPPIPQREFQHGKGLEATLQGDVLEEMHEFIETNLAARCVDKDRVIIALAKDHNQSIAGCHQAGNAGAVYGGKPLCEYAQVFHACCKTCTDALPEGVTHAKVMLSGNPFADDVADEGEGGHGAADASAAILAASAAITLACAVVALL
jgi:hypothetical protein